MKVATAVSVVVFVLSSFITAKAASVLNKEDTAPLFVRNSKDWFCNTCNNNEVANCKSFYLKQRCKQICQIEVDCSHYDRVCTETCQDPDLPVARICPLVKDVCRNDCRVPVICKPARSQQQLEEDDLQQLP